MSRRHLLLSITLLATCPGIAPGELILWNVDFIGADFGSQNMSGAAVLGQSGDVWNIISQPPNQNPKPAGRTVSLFDSTGVSSAHDLLLTYSSQTGSDGGSAIVGTNGPVPALMREVIHGTPGSGGSGGTSGAQLLFSFDAPASFSNQEFRVIAYAAFHHTSSSGTTFFRQVNGPALGQTLGPNSALIEGQNYADFNITADANGDFAFFSNYTPGSAVNWGPVNGFQITAVDQTTAIPEPSTFVTSAAMTGLGYLRWRRYRRCSRLV